jgi:cytochrome d ubiquinol oxidase subunit I
LNAFVPGVKDIIDGGYPTKNGPALSAQQKMAKGKVAIQALADYRKAVKEGDKAAAQQYDAILKQNYAYFGYGYIKDSKDLIPSVPLTFYAFHIMVILGGYFIVLFIVLLLLGRKGKIADIRWLQWVGLWSIPLAYIASQAGWVVAEVGRQPWAIQDLLPVNAAVSNLSTSSVQTTFFLFLVLFTVLLIAEIRILLKAIKQGPELPE